MPSPPVNPAVAAALRAHIEYLRDLGLYDLYRKGGAEAVELAQASEADVPIADAPDPASGVVPSKAKDLQSGSQEPAIPAPPAESYPALPAEDTPIPRPTLPTFTPGAFIPPEHRPALLNVLREEIGDCHRCPLGFAGRHSIVLGDGDPAARLFFVGEGPGADEDAQGLPFVGRAGQLLNNMISAMGLRREEVYIANIVKCRPPQNRTPEPVEAATCLQFLHRQLDLVRPEVIVALGSTAATYLLGAKSSLAGLRGRIHPAFGAKLIVTYHPAFLLRDPRQKKEAWADLQIAMRELRA